MKRFGILPLSALLSALLFTGCAAMKPAVTTESPVILPAEGPVPGVPPEVEYADYWIRTADNVDDIILTHDQIDEFNTSNPRNGDGFFDVLAMPEEIEGSEVNNNLSFLVKYLLDNDYYIMDNIPVEQTECDRIVALMDTSGVPSVVTPKLGMTLRRVQGKVWPTTVLFTRTPGDVEFDSTVGSALDMGTPVALLHTSRDGRWVYVRNRYYTCWLPANAVAFGDRAVIEELVDRSNPVVAIGHRVTVFADPNLRAAAGSIQMGSYLPLRTSGLDWCEVLMPGRGADGKLAIHRGYVKKDSQISMGFLPYTIRNVYRQLFATFGHRYGWAGMFEERDCSRYTMDVFRSFGFILPRTSSTLIRSSKAILDLKEYDRETKIEILKNSPGGISIVGWPGHVMVYLGHVGDTLYVAQATWGMRTPVGDGVDQTHRLARVLVSDLMMDDGSTRGPRIDRLTSIAIMGNYAFEE